MALSFRYAQLPNGLDIIAETNPDSYSIALGFFVKTGSRDEDPSVHGVSHFLEHMMFKGSAKYTWEDVNRIFDEMGARYNAYTTQELTSYYANVLPEFTEVALEHLSHLLRPALRTEDFLTEKKVILEEIAMYLDDPGHRLYESLMESHFGSHPLSRSILGSPEAIARLQQPQMAEYFTRRYGPGSMVLVATGMLDFDRLIALAEKYCGSWPTVNAPRQDIQPVCTSHQRKMSDPKLNRLYTMAMTPAPSAQDERRFAARVLSDVIGDCDGSRFYWAMVDNAIAESAELSFYPHDGCGSYYLSLVTDPDRGQQALDIGLKELRKVRADLNADEVDRAKNKMASSLVLQGEVPMGRLYTLGGQWIYNKEYRSLEQDMSTLLSITPRSLHDLIDQFPFDPMTVVTLGPAE